jgi:hypothetical protein
MTGQTFRLQQNKKSIMATKNLSDVMPDDEKLTPEERDRYESEKLAGQIETLKVILPFINLEHLKKSAKQFREQASFQDSAAVLNPNYDSKRSDSLRESANALEHLAGFVESMLKITEMKAKVARNQIARDQINKLFM